MKTKTIEEKLLYSVLLAIITIAVILGGIEL
jgi:hypothetical protein